MAIQCRLIDRAEAMAKTPAQSGDMWFDELKESDGVFYCYSGRLSRQYLETWKDKRPPLIVVCPNGEEFGIDTTISGPDREWHGWTVTGDPPNITVSPSINLVGRWHGWLKDGVFTDA